ncbi:NAD(P)-binding protein [Gracilibacillus sp. S3-1-1]|uniref:NAD(P)-binding protein n=1 Tax=Gracilibacillus pellucidus TaxID=3095368 RepID=A0ACC6M1S7_9BACI|nr:NAD(P)-binding protein [Gracilibacillus sp. S3-1-1]MDX8044825.1 NAD(P)-binding protein [Gracilibacillus sp. S3-1-1]
MTNFLPFFIDLKDKKIVIIGGGNIAERRIKRLLPFREHISIVSPTLTESLEQMIQSHHISWVKETCQKQHLQHADFIVIATNDPTTNRYITENAPASAWVNASHQADAGNIHFPTTIEKGRLKIAISTGGASPILAKKIKDSIEQAIPDQYDKYIDFLFEARQLIKQSKLTNIERKQLLQELVESPIYAHTEQQKWLEQLK